MGNIQTVTIIDIPFVNMTHTQFVETIVKRHLLEQKKCFIVTANPEIVMEARRNPDYKNTLLQANYIVPDGSGILLAAKCKKTPLKERIAGFDLMVDMLKLANEHGSRCFFLGGKEAVVKQTVAVVNNKYPNIQIVGSHHGYFDLNDKKVAQYVKASNPDFVFVALGFPKQETWINRNLSDFKHGIFIGVGGSFDVLSGNVKRAPDFWIKLNLEWLYRVIKQPFRIKRLFPIFRFIGLILKKKT